MAVRGQRKLMTERHKAILLGKKKAISDNLDSFNTIVGALKQEGIIDSNAQREMLNKPGREQKIFFMLETMTRREDVAFDILVKCLSDSNQEHLVDLLHAPLPEDRSPTDRQKYGEPMSEENKKKLLNLRPDIVANMAPKTIVNKLFAYGHLGSYEIGRARRNASASEINTELVDLMLRKSELAFTDFTRFLKEDGQEHILQLVSPKASDGSNAKSDNSETDLKTQLLRPEMWQVYHDVCMKGNREVFQTRIMLVGHFGAGKTSIKRSLLHESFTPVYKTTDALCTEDQEVLVETGVGWKKATREDRENFQKLAGKELKRQVSDPKLVPEKVGLASSTDTANHSATRPAVETTTTVRDQKPHQTSRPQSKSNKRSESPDKVAERLRKMQIGVVAIAAEANEEDQEGEAIFSIWDFGGQNIYYSLHQTFLCSRAIYLLVTDITKDLHHVLDTSDRPLLLKDAGAPRTILDFLDFWLNSVHTHLRERTQNGEYTLSPPVIIVCTKTDMLDMNERDKSIYIRNYIQSIHENMVGKPYYQHVCDIIAVSNKDREEDIPSLRVKIESIARRQPYWGERHPMKWILLANELREKVDRGEKCMSLDDIFKSAKSCGVAKDEVRAFLEFHHNLGDLVYFDATGTHETVFLSPEWLASVFSKVMTQDKIFEERKIPPKVLQELKRGRISHDAVVRLCESSSANTLIKIMVMFDILVPYQPHQGNGRQSEYLVPCLLPRASHQKTQGEGFPKIHFRLVSRVQHEEEVLMDIGEVSGFLPSGLFNRVISKCCRIDGWRHQSIFYDYMVIEVDEFCFSICMTDNGITLSAFNFRGKAEDHSSKLSEIRCKIQSIIEEITEQVLPNLLCLQYIECSCLMRTNSRDLHLSFATRRAQEERGHVLITIREKSRRIECPHHKIMIELCEWDIWFGTIWSLEQNRSMSDAARRLYSDLQPHMDHLLDSSPHRVQDRLRCRNYISITDVESIEGKPTTRGKNLEMYHILLTNVKSRSDGEAVKSLVCEGLCQSSQYCPFRGTRRPIQEFQSDELRDLRDRLLEDMEVQPVLDELCQAEIVDGHIKEVVESKRTRRERVDSLVSFISRTHSEAYVNFMKILRKTNWWIFTDIPPK